MTRAALCVSLVLAFAVAATAIHAHAPSDQQALIALERKWNDAFYRKDIATIQALLADEFVATYDDGSRGDKKKELRMAMEFNQQVKSSVPDNFSVKVYRDTAVVWFTLRVVGIKQGKPSELKFSYSDVWVMRDGRWQCVSSHSTRVAPPK